VRILYGFISKETSTAGLLSFPAGDAGQFVLAELKIHLVGPDYNEPETNLELLAFIGSRGYSTATTTGQ